MNVDVRITNQTEYEGWAYGLNGIQSKEGGGTFGVVNLLAPRGGVQRTWTQMKYEFVNSQTGEPTTIPRTFLTFYDFDTALNKGRECIQVRGANEILTSQDPMTELTWGVEDAPTLGAEFETWSEDMYCATTRGIGNDNPTQPDTLTDLQKQRALMIEVVDKSSIECADQASN